MTSTGGDEVLDEAYERLFAYGPEFEGYLSNHGPMVVEVLSRHQRSEVTHAWLDRYMRRLEPAPSSSSVIRHDEWRDALGDATRVGDWLGFFGSELEERPWREVLAEWWPRLAPGAVGAATHGLIRAGHAVRSVEASETGPRLRELGMALGYWAARFRPLPPASQAAGHLGPAEALAHLPRVEHPAGGAAARLAELDTLGSWPDGLAALRPPAEGVDVASELDALVDGAVAQYLEHGRAEPIMLVHAATAPAAAAAALPSLSPELWVLSWQAAWSATAAITSCYSATEAEPGRLQTSLTQEEVLSRAVDNGDEHVIKFADVALVAHERGCGAALSAASHAVSLVD